jgi:hypothetical protein
LRQIIPTKRSQTMKKRRRKKKKVKKKSGPHQQPEVDE